MLADSPAFSGFAVDDVEKAQKFYGEVPRDQDVGQRGRDPDAAHRGRPVDTIAYPKPGHGPAEFTILNFPVEDIDRGGGRARRPGRAVRALRRHAPGREGHHARGRTSSSPGSGTRQGNVLSVLQPRQPEGAAQQPQASPRQASRASRTATAAMPSATSGSAHHQPSDRVGEQPDEQRRGQVRAEHRLAALAGGRRRAERSADAALGDGQRRHRRQRDDRGPMPTQLHRGGGPPTRSRTASTPT